MSDLVCLTKGWLLTDVLALPIIDKVVLDRYLRALHYEMKAAESLQNLEEFLTKTSRSC